MINHARTLLLNLPGPHEKSQAVPGDVYVPSYAPLDAPDWMRNARSVLFGSDPDYDGMVYRTAQYMTVLHASKYAAYVYDLDSRITYDPSTAGIADSTAFAPRVYGASGLTVNGSWSGPQESGRCLTRWRVEATSMTSLQVENQTDGLAAAYTAGDTYTLPGSTYVLSINEQPFVPGTAWWVISRSRPQPELGTVYSRLLELPDKVKSYLFAGSSVSEPYATFNALYRHHWAAPYRMTGLLLALIYRTEELRNG